VLLWTNNDDKRTSFEGIGAVFFWARHQCRSLERTVSKHLDHANTNHSGFLNDRRDFAFHQKKNRQLIRKDELAIRLQILIAEP
jgi:hypothetical protein